MSEVSAFGVIHKGIPGNLKAASKAKLAGNNPLWDQGLTLAQRQTVRRHVHGKNAAKNFRRGLGARARSDMEKGKDIKALQRERNAINNKENLYRWPNASGKALP